MLRILMGVIVMSLVLFSGCGGGGSTPVVLTGNYSPLNIGSTWTYALNTWIETTYERLEARGRVTRTVVGRRDVMVNGSPVSALLVESTYTGGVIPPLSAVPSNSLVQYLDIMFSAVGGLNSSQSYYLHQDLTGDGVKEQVLLAWGRGGEAPLVVSEPRPFITNPPIPGIGNQTTALPIAMPLMPPAANMNDLRVHSKLLNYGPETTNIGTFPTVVQIDSFDAAAITAPFQGTLSGRSRLFLQLGVGLVRGDWEATVNLNGGWALVGSAIEIATYAR